MNNTRRRVSFRFKSPQSYVVVHHAIVNLYLREQESRAYSNDVSITIDDYEHIKGCCIETLQHNLPNECQQLNIPVIATTFKRADFGSLELIFTTTWEIIQFAGSIASFLDAIRLVNLLAEKILSKAANDSCRKGLAAEVTCTQVFPSNRSLESNYCNKTSVCSQQYIAFNCSSWNLSSTIRTIIIFLCIIIMIQALILAWLSWRLIN